ncbi:bifunctional DNA primase/polymerase [Streptomyces lunaelactis]|uniref:bifunctional DNA primase/polymerase n=1 Tax=Streptomyces lunaelactis TaxID=1535768 RepID=UPI0015859CDD|nr:bifunctional DNA primase/polymerase [Streptomyces lunaelactis]NUK22852.1 bifunctional DNA primase/polymerase [Streptomyces lunaelactis]
MPPDLGISGSDSSWLAVTEDDGHRPGTPLDTALWCAEQDWPVHPLAPGRKTPAANCTDCRDRPHSPQACPCIAAGRWCHGFHAATTDPSRILAWWTEQPRFGVGVACGAAGLVVIDVDAHPVPLPDPDRLLPGIHIPASVTLDGLRHGFHSLALLAALRGAQDPSQDDTTLRVRTPSGGLHLWYTAQAGHTWRCSTGSSAGRALAWQVDVRAHGGYIIAPGTTTATGTYTACRPVRRPAPLPGWLAAELERTGHRPAPPAPRSATPVPSRARAAVIAACGGRDAASRTLATVLTAVTECAAIAQGAGFSEKLNRAAFTAGGLVGAGRMNLADAESALVAAAAHARPGQERRSLQIIRGGMSAGSRRPLNPGDRT